MTIASPTEEKNTTTPMMAQWHACKQAAGTALVLFRLGDFYEAFYDDALIMSKELELTLTKRQNIPMCGIPHHTSETYIDRLVSKGFRVAVAEQTEDAKNAKGLVRREITRVVSPGTVINSTLLSDKCNNFIVAINRVGKLYGLAVLDLTTADFRVIELENEQDVLNELSGLLPSEIITSEKVLNKSSHLFDDLKKGMNFLLTLHDDWRFDHQVAHDVLLQHLKVKNLDGFGLRGMVSAINAAGGLISYLQDILSLHTDHIREIGTYSTSSYMLIDRATQRHLELTEPQGDASKKTTLLYLLDQTCTPMGGRMLRQWIKRPLIDPELICERQEAVQSFFDRPDLMNTIAASLETIRDLERLIMRASSGYAQPRDLVSLKNSYESIPLVKSLLAELCSDSKLLSSEFQMIEELPEMTKLIATALVDEPPLRLSDGNIFRDGYCKELDELREISKNSKAWLSNYQEQLKETTGIRTLKVGFNRMFGYYIEVSKGQAEKMPEHFQRRQTLVNAERFITPDLKEYENKVMHAEERISSIESELFQALRSEVAQYSPIVQKTAQALGKIDTLRSLASVAKTHAYVKPTVDNSDILHIVEGRHPVIESIQMGEKFISNDTYLDNATNRLLLITGPNMAGKSTFIRQVALMTILAQMGSFVPATKAHIGIIDKVFSRIGASDDLSRGQSTFMVEMTETANILNNCTSRSLVILDEIGRGTSTYDGISIAWSVAEYLLTAEEKNPKTLFATHYWELTKLEEKVPGAVNYNVAVHESGDSIIFLRKIVRGGTDKSYGIHVARLAGMPEHVVLRAKEILLHLEENSNRKTAFEPSQVKKVSGRTKNKVQVNQMQLTFFD